MVSTILVSRYFVTTTICRHGSLVETSTTVYGRKIPLADIIMAENQRLLIEISRSSLRYKMSAFDLLTYQDNICNVLALECDITPQKWYCIDLYYFLSENSLSCDFKHGEGD